ncbi:MAG: FAD-dependent thymidylate synthase, partial [Acidobacteria bacterium]|nr:FAD-dependent thymidylate synthase [Acidobacteriota bacterium]
RATGKAMLAQLKTVIPEFVQRVERPDRGGQWIDFLKKRRRFERTLAACTPTAPPEAPEGAAAEVKLVESDPDGEARVLAGLAHEATDEPFETLVQHAKALPAEIRESILARCAADRSNRRHKPGRGLEQARYTFEVTGDYGAFRDLQRHRMLTIEWQKLSTAHGLTEPPEIQEMGADQEWNQAMNAAQEAYEYVQLSAGPTVAQYCVPMAFHIQFLLTLNARELMHMIELRTQPQGHPSYRRVCQAMHRLIADNAGHRGIAKLISFANHDDVDLERLEAEKRAHARAGA